MYRRQAGRSGLVVWGAVFAFCMVPLLVAGAESLEFASDLPPEEMELLQEYRPYYERLKRFYNNMEMDVIHRESDSPAYQSEENPEGKRATRLVYRANAGEFFRIDEAQLNIDDESPTGRLVIRLVRPEGFVVVRRNTPDAPLAVTGWSDNRDRGVALLSSYMFQWSPYSMYVMPMESFVFHQPAFAETYKIEEVTAHEDGGERLVTLTVRSIMKRSGNEWQGSFVFYRDRSWALKELSWGYANPTEPSDVVRNTQYEYDGMNGQFPLLKRVEYWQEFGPDRRVGVKEVFEVQGIEPGPVPIEEFSGEALGFRVGTQRPKLVTNLIGLLIGVFLLALYFILRRRESRQTGTEKAEG
jgi:hypothetical protein